MGATADIGSTKTKTKTKKPAARGPKPEDLEHILPDLRGLAVRVSKLKLDPRNARLHNARNLDAIRASLATFQQRKNLVIRRDGTVVAGNGTLEVALTMGWKWIAATYVDDSDAEATAYALADNKTAELSEWDTSMLEELLKDIQGGDEDLLNAIGFADQEIERILRGGLDASDSPEQEWGNSGMPDFRQEDMTGVFTLIVHFQDQEHVDQFATLVGQSLTEKTRSIWFPKAEWQKVQDKRVVSEP